jgi:hypothetical protein
VCGSSSFSSLTLTTHHVKEEEEEKVGEERKLVIKVFDSIMKQQSPTADVGD